MAPCFTLQIAILDDHNNTVMQENQNIRLSWPAAAEPTFSSLDLGLPTNAYWGALPAEASLVGSNNPFSIGYGADPHNKNPLLHRVQCGHRAAVAEESELEGRLRGFGRKASIRRLLLRIRL